MKRINLYYRTPPLGYKWIPGDRHIIKLVRGILKAKQISGVDKVFMNLCKGLDELKIEYTKNQPFHKINPDDAIIVLGRGKYSLKGYEQPNKVIAGIGLMTHPSEWPTLLDEYPVAKYLQHSSWANEVYVRYYSRENCGLWPAGVDTQKWSPDNKADKKFDLLVYNKLRWDKDKMAAELKSPILNMLNELGITYREIVYGQYNEADYFSLLQQCHAMIFLCEHESQGFACCEAMSMNIPVFAWDQGYCLDPNRFSWNDPAIPATSIPFFDDKCGMSFKDLLEFEAKFGIFWQKVKSKEFNSREYVLNNITLKKSAERMLAIIKEVYA